MLILKIIIFSIIVLSSNIYAQDNGEQENFSEFLASIKQIALAKNISTQTIDNAFYQLQPNQKILALDKRQPEFTISFGKYLTTRVSANRLNKAKVYYKKNQKKLTNIYKKYGVAGHIIVSFLALESNLGLNTGKFNNIEALATLAFDLRRRDFFTNELLHSLQLIDNNYIPRNARGSWAGAMGAVQFMPSNITNYAIDTNDDNLDIWRDEDDIFASAANFLVKIGWQRGQKWGREVLLPANFDYSLSGLANKQPLEYWRNQGVLDNKQQTLPQSKLLGSIIIPSGYKGPAFLVYNNFKAILRWNRSILYAIAVGHLSDKIIVDTNLTNYPIVSDYLTKKEVITIQEWLDKLGFDVGEADGVVGRKTRAAAKEFQIEYQLIADGFVGRELLVDIKEIIQDE